MLTDFQISEKDVTLNWEEFFDLIGLFLRFLDQAYLLKQSVAVLEIERQEIEVRSKQKMFWTVHQNVLSENWLCAGSIVLTVAFLLSYLPWWIHKTFYCFLMFWGGFSSYYSPWDHQWSSPIEMLNPDRAQSHRIQEVMDTFLIILFWSIAISLPWFNSRGQSSLKGPVEGECKFDLIFSRLLSSPESLFVEGCLTNRCFGSSSQGIDTTGWFVTYWVSDLQKLSMTQRIVATLYTLMFVAVE